MTLRYMLSARESRFWHHQNPDIARWGQAQVWRRIDERWPDHERVDVHDQDESYLASSIASDRWV